jgi:hypothetical protein
MIDFSKQSSCFGGYLMKPNASAAKWGSNAPASVVSGDPYYGRPLPFYKDGGDWTRDIGRPVLVGEEGEELAVGRDGRAQLLGSHGPESVVPQAPATVLPAGTFDVEKARRMSLARRRY